MSDQVDHISPQEQFLFKVWRKYKHWVADTEATRTAQTEKLGEMCDALKQLHMYECPQSLRFQFNFFEEVVRREKIKLTNTGAKAPP
jgi:hypothetical protein